MHSRSSWPTNPSRPAESSLRTAVAKVMGKQVGAVLLWLAKSLPYGVYTPQQTSVLTVMDQYGLVSEQHFTTISQVE